MKRKMKELLVVLMVLGLIAAACGDDDAAEPAASPDDGASTDEPDVSDEPATTAADAEDEEAMLDELNVAYFLEWPTANQVAQARGTYDEVLGLTLNWTPFASGGDIAQAMEAGSIDIAYSQGLTPFANFVTSGADQLIVSVAVSYADADNCVANPDLGITAENAAQTLPGQSVYTPLGNTTHYKLLSMLDHLGVDTSGIEFIQSEGGPAAVAALESGAVALSCAFGGSVNQMLEAGGNLLMTGSEQEAVGILTFDVVTTTRSFADAHPDIVTGFLQVTEDANKAYNEDREPFIDIIAEASGLDREATIALLDAFTFPEREALLSETWLGGTVQATMKGQMDFFVEQGEIDSALLSYDSFVDTSFLEAIN